MSDGPSDDTSVPSVPTDPSEPMRLHLAEGVSSTAAAEALIDAYDRLSAWPDKAQRAVEAVRRGCADRRSAALADAAGAVAAMVDADPLRFDRHGYHNRQHFCEVVLAVGVLAGVHRLPDHEAQLLVLAAIVHDVVHDGRTDSRFRLERESAECASPVLSASAVDLADGARLMAMVLATEPAEGVRCAIGARRFHAVGGAPPQVPEAAPELAALLADARLAELAVLLCEADVLPSVGLTFDYGLRVQDRLAREWGRRLAARHKLAFIDRVLADGVIGPFFAPNAAAVRQELARRIDAPDDGQ